MASVEHERVRARTVMMKEVIKFALSLYLQSLIFPASQSRARFSQGKDGF